ncbi:SCO family protein [Sulfitobacter sp. TSTF-M16]|uniref:SCO family protein n=1 Tax=Sulfitobacter aestuariivivens TaxID=2766981 RepID=A0A927D3B0_9RHOB|nr:SCO family protein [Sulfitobacter aestuariivivens]MBD3664308.1 SCO family protein [Sulfitobacter aestuariivivens]
MKALITALMVLATPVWAQTALPFDVGGPFALTDHTGAPRTQQDPEGQPQLLFFGYANCPGICTAALPLMVGIVEQLAKKGVTATPVMITVDPARDQVGNMEALLKYHPDFIGLTGDPSALQAAYEAFSIDHELAYEDPEYGPVYSHGSMVYLLDGQGEVLTLIPPVVDEWTAAEIALKYVSGPG